MRNPGEVAETQHLNRPRVGVFIGMNSINSSNNQTSSNNNNSSNLNNPNSNIINRIPSKFENNKLLITKQPNHEVFQPPKLLGKKFYLDSHTQTAEKRLSNKLIQFQVSKSDEFTFTCSTNKKHIEFLTQKEEEEKTAEVKNGIHKFYSTGCKKKKASEEAVKTNEENLNEKKEIIFSDLGSSKTKFSLLKKLSEKNIINVKPVSTNNIKESKIEDLFRETKSISKPFSTNQLKLNINNNITNGKTPVIVKGNINSKPINTNNDKKLEKNTSVVKDPNKFRKTSSKK